MKKILVVNNDDSFIYNLVELLRVNGNCTFDVVMTDDINLDIVENYDAILLSPGSNLPSYYPKMVQLIEACHLTHSILGVCLGFQALAVHFGAILKRLDVPKHGHVSRLSLLGDSDRFFGGVSEPILVGRYHSWVVSRDSLPKEIIVSSVDEDGNVMSFHHCSLPIFGVQFHPESIMTSQGRVMIDNWIGSNSTRCQGYSKIACRHC